MRTIVQLDIIMIVEVYNGILERYYESLLEEATIRQQHKRPLTYVSGRYKNFWKKMVLQLFLIGRFYRLTSNSLRMYVTSSKTPFTPKILRQ